MKEKLILLYDGDCPICQNYRDYIELRKNYDIELLNARENIELTKELFLKGYDINSGIILIKGENIFHKHEALVEISFLSKPIHRFDRLIYSLSRKRSVMKIIYPFLFHFRKLLLKIKNIDSNILK